MNRLLRMFLYFKRAHSTYFSFIIQIINSVNLFFVVFILLGILESNLQDYILLLLFLIISYLPIAIIVGRWDFKQGSFVTSAKITRENSPLFQELFERLDRLEKKRKD